ncbi:MAG: ATP-dependent DNA helicase [Endomicrobia bacterium]|nr:ATP-dependent DNA helicase [Endomicrobiia bacterium]MCX7716092.1 ATP-dependent DNA helicase [Endomicrobiia bacterium]
MHTTNQFFQQIFTNILTNFITPIEIREQQIIMAQEIFNSFLNNKKIIIEAPTGIGKSLAYLIPSAVFLNERKNVRVIVSTYTKTLQQQLLTKDLPIVNKIIQQLYHKNLNFMTFFGSENYICLNRFYELKHEPLTTSELIKLLQIEHWLENTKTGCVEEIKIDDIELWQEINREIDLCRGKKCKFYDICFYYKNLHQLKLMDVIVVNHHLFFANILSAGKLLPKDNINDEIIIFDEAHNLEDVILQCLGEEITNSQLLFFCKQIYNPKKQRGLLTKLHSLPDTWKQNVMESILNLNASLNQFFTDLMLKFPDDKNEVRIFVPNIVEDVVSPALVNLINLLKPAKNMVKTDEEFYKINHFINRAINFNSLIKNWLNCKDTQNYIYWMEKEENKRKKIKITLRVTPLEVAYDMQEKVYSAYDKIVFTSATLCVDKKYNFFKTSVGLEPEVIPDCTSTKELTLSSPFDYENNVILYLPENIPNPKTEPEEYKKTITELISQLLSLTKGNSFVLFTSFELMQYVYENISIELPILLQTTSKYKMLEQYKNTDNCVLFGVDTFWQGVDIPGEKLISIIIPKLPFDVPDHPVVEAKVEKIKLNGKNPFKEYLLPTAIIKLKQGFGRLIRRKTDWGIISILDPRIKKQWYGKYFLNSLPECKTTANFNEVEKFYKNKKLISHSKL